MRIDGAVQTMIATRVVVLALLAACLTVSASQAQDAETTPLRHPEHYRYDFNIADMSMFTGYGPAPVV